MRNILIATTLPVVLATLPATAVGLDLFRPVTSQTSQWSCTVDSLGQDGGALGLSETEMVGIATNCTLSNPVQIRDMDAVLYDAQCRGETAPRRTMIMPSLAGVYIIQNNFVTEWQRCLPG